MTNQEMLKGVIAESGLKLGYIAEQLGINRASLYNKLNGKSKFNQEEIKILCSLLKITSLKEKEAIFFS